MIIEYFFNLVSIIALIIAINGIFNIFDIFFDKKKIRGILVDKKRLPIKYLIIQFIMKMFIKDDK